MRIGPEHRFWVVTDPGPHSDLRDICHETDLAGLALQFRGGLDPAAENATIFTSQEEAHEEAKNRLVVWKIARQIRAERGLPLTEVVRVTLHDEAGNVIWKGDVR